jgi:hypothetical protein
MRSIELDTLPAEQWKTLGHDRERFFLGTRTERERVRLLYQGERLTCAEDVILLLHAGQINVARVARTS